MTGLERRAAEEAGARGHEGGGAGAVKARPNPAPAAYRKTEMRLGDPVGSSKWSQIGA